MVTELFTHSHDHAPELMNSGKMMTPLQEAAAKNYVATTDSPTTKSLEHALLAANLLPLPAQGKLSGWLKRENQKKMKATGAMQLESLRQGAVSNVAE